jgi:hypothetical protein
VLIAAQPMHHRQALGGEAEEAQRVAVITFANGVEGTLDLLFAGLFVHDCPVCEW